MRNNADAFGSEARFDRVLYDGGEFGHAGEVAVGSEEEMDFLGIPGLLEPDQVRNLLKHRQSERAAEQARQQAGQARRTDPDHPASTSPLPRIASGTRRAPPVRGRVFPQTGPQRPGRPVRSARTPG